MAKAVLVAVDLNDAEPSFLNLFAVAVDSIDAAIEAVRSMVSVDCRVRQAGHLTAQQTAEPGSVWRL